MSKTRKLEKGETSSQNLEEEIQKRAYEISQRRDEDEGDFSLCHHDLWPWFD